MSSRDGAEVCVGGRECFGASGGVVMLAGSSAYIGSRKYCFYGLVGAGGRWSEGWCSVVGRLLSDGGVSVCVWRPGGREGWWCSDGWWEGRGWGLRVCGWWCVSIWVAIGVLWGM